MTAQYNSNFQGARTLGQGGVELNWGYTWYEGGVDNYQITLGFGVIDRFDLKLNYQRSISSFYRWGVGLNYLTVEPKVALVPDYVALSVPFGIWFGEFENKVWVVSPKLLFSYAPVQYFEATFTPKLDVIFIDGGETEVLVGLNLGFAVSSDIDKWAIRPEAGYMFNPKYDKATSWNGGVAASVNLTNLGKKDEPTPKGF